MERRGRPGEGPNARLSSKREVQIRHAREQKEKGNVLISPGFSKSSAQALVGCLPPNGSTAWRAGVDRERARRFGLVARGRSRLGTLEGTKRRGTL